MSASDDPNYVGRGRPPREHQFPKGTSGNPRGRPKKRPARDLPLGDPFLNRLMMAMLTEPVQITLPSGDATELSTLEGILMAIRIKALKGSVHAQRGILNIAATLQADRLEAHAGLTRLAAVQLAAQETAVAAAARRGDDVGSIKLNPTVEFDSAGYVGLADPTSTTFADLMKALRLQALALEVLETNTSLNKRKRTKAASIARSKALNDLEDANAQLPLHLRKSAP